VTSTVTEDTAMTKDNAEPPLAAERRHLAKHTADLIQQGHNGKWVCVTGERILGVFSKPLAAYEAGIAVLGAAMPFLVEKVGDGAG
jgi:hypothetical protein